MTLTPFMILILAAFAVFVGVLGVVSIWSKTGSSKAQPARAVELERSELSVS